MNVEVHERDRCDHYIALHVTKKKRVEKACIELTNARQCFFCNDQSDVPPASRDGRVSYEGTDWPRSNLAS